MISFSLLCPYVYSLPMWLMCKELRCNQQYSCDDAVVKYMREQFCAHMRKTPQFPTRGNQGVGCATVLHGYTRVLRIRGTLQRSVQPGTGRCWAARKRVRKRRVPDRGCQWNRRWCQPCYSPRIIVVCVWCSLTGELPARKRIVWRDDNPTVGSSWFATSSLDTTPPGSCIMLHS